MFELNRDTSYDTIAGDTCTSCAGSLDLSLLTLTLLLILQERPAWGRS
jgi:hypothetical protein